MSRADHDPKSTWSTRALQVIPGGASTGSKREGALYGSALDVDLPTHMRRAWGCRIEAADGREMVDCTMALGAVAFGYADAQVNAAAISAIHAGQVGGLSPLLEVEVAERLVDTVPCAEQVRFLKTGAEATSAAVKLARAATERSTVIASGYFGWHDWSNPGAGVPLGAHSDVITVPFDDIAALHAAVKSAGQTLAAIVLEPLVHHVASKAWLQAARDACDAVHAVLIFDEIKTAFRIRTGGVQELLGVVPDLTSIGKAMANGFPMAAVVGQRDVMDFARSAWISSTLASDTAGLAATRAVLDRHQQFDVCAELARVGTHMQQVVRDALSHTALGLDGPPAMWRITSENSEQLDGLVARAARGGVLLKRGAYQFPSLAHDTASMDEIHRAVAHAARDL